VFATLRRPDVTLAVWRRNPPPELQPALHRWAAGSSSTYDEEFGASGFDLSPALAGVDDAGLRAFLAHDMWQLVARLIQVTRAPRFRVVFGTVRGDQCRKFHTDMLKFRLITTYLGPGTEWLEESNVDRAALNDPPACPVAANAAIVRDSAAIQRARSGDVLIMKGAGAAGLRRAVVHRSPPIEGTGVVRLVLALSVYECSS
jgi:hypothetical protein